jgi:two-component system OmpR family response regulator
MHESASLLIVDDDPRVSRVLTRLLTAAGYSVNTALNGSEMREFMTANKTDLVILDLQLPGEHGLELTRQLQQTTNVGIIIVSGTGDNVDRVVGLEGGADDYLSKPVDERELLARVRSVLRRVREATQNGAVTESDVLCFSEWILDTTSHELKSTSGEETILTSHEFELLKTLALSPNRVMSRDQLMDKIAGRGWMPNDRSIDVLVGKLRKKIEENPNKPSIIKTIRGAGYKFTARIL